MNDVNESWADELAEENAAPVKESLIKMISRLVKDADNIEAVIYNHEEEIKKLKSSLKEILEKRIPDLMAQAEVKKLSTDTGLEVEVKPYVNISIPADNKAEAIRWLIEAGHGGIVKNEVVVPFAAGLNDAANELVKELRQQGYDHVEHDVKIHAQTLGAWGREMVEQAQLIPSCFNIHTGMTTKITEQKRKK